MFRRANLPCKKCMIMGAEVKYFGIYPAPALTERLTIASYSIATDLCTCRLRPGQDLQPAMSGLGVRVGSRDRLASLRDADDS